ncbi:MAG TPA: class I SAM-dependent methyltransferase [Paludibacteraceae bacterium]|jgi:predicted O-methyltransferase YrrM|nr:class I SAM-dependent methyltransferase [Paludibacteraceae bacterium]HQB69594.1 class I SAM-dependent methyltransferase [Paludibacteraceae bacterium]
MNTLFRISAFVHYWRHAKHHKGFGVHSPFVFHWLNHVLYEKDFFYAYQQLRTIRKELLSNTTKIQLSGFGTAALRTTTIRKIAKKSTTKQKYAELIFRIANNINAEQILELGTNLGLTTMHLAAANSQANITTIEGEKSLCHVSTALFNKYNFNNIALIQGNIDVVLPKLLDNLPKLDIVFFDANHTYEATINYFQLCLPKIHSKTVFIFDDIHWSKAMEQAWREIKKHPQTRVDIDIFQMGIVLFNPDLQKESYIVKF